MTYVDPNFKTKKALKEAIEKWQLHLDLGDPERAGRMEVMVYDPGIQGLNPNGGLAFIEGPHYPKPHRWYAQVEYNSSMVVTRFVK